MMHETLLLKDDTLCLNRGDEVVFVYDADVVPRRRRAVDETLIYTLLLRCVFEYGLSCHDARTMLFGELSSTARKECFAFLASLGWEGGSRFMTSLYHLMDTLAVLKEEKGFGALLAYTPLLHNVLDTCARTHQLPDARTMRFVRTCRQRLWRLVYKRGFRTHNSRGQELAGRVNRRYDRRRHDAEQRLLLVL